MGVIINSITVEEANSKMISLNWGIYLQNISRLKVTVSARAVPPPTNIKLRGLYGSVEGNNNYHVNTGAVSSFNKSFETSPLRLVGNQPVGITIPVTEGIAGTGSSSYTVVSYATPQITEATAKRVNSSNVEDENGTYLNITFKGTIDSVGNRNKNIFKIGYKEKGSADDYTYKVLVNDDKTTYTLNYDNYRFTDITLDTTKNYEIAFFAIDEFYSKDTTRDILLGFDLLNFNPSGKSMAIGTISTRGANEEVLDVALKGNFKNGIYINDTDILDMIYPVGYIIFTPQADNYPAVGSWSLRMTYEIKNHDYGTTDIIYSYRRNS